MQHGSGVLLALVGLGCEPVQREQRREAERVGHPRRRDAEEPAGERPLPERAAERDRGPEVPEDEPRDVRHRLPSQRWIVSMKALGYSGGIRDPPPRPAT